jgi:hypothetical protein
VKNLDRGRFQAIKVILVFGGKVAEVTKLVEITPEGSFIGFTIRQELLQ